MGGREGAWACLRGGKRGGAVFFSPPPHPPLFVVFLVRKEGRRDTSGGRSMQGRRWRDDALLVAEELAVIGIKSTYVCVYVCGQRVTSKVAGKGTRHWSGVVGKEQDMGRLVAAVAPRSGRGPPSPPEGQEGACWQRLCVEAQGCRCDV